MVRVLVSTVATIARQPDGTWLASCTAPALLVLSRDRDDAEARLRALAAEYLRTMESLPPTEREAWLADLRARGADCRDVPAAAELVSITMAVGA